MKFKNSPRFLLILSACVATWQVMLSGHAIGAEPALPHESASSPAFDTYLLLSAFATERRDQRGNGYVPLLERIGLSKEAKDRLVELSVEARNKDLAFQRVRLSAMCDLGNKLHTKELLANEYVTYSADIERNQEFLAESVLAKLLPSDRDALVSWRELWFSPSMKRISGSEYDAIVGSSYSAQDILQKFCDTLKDVVN